MSKLSEFAQQEQQLSELRDANERLSKKLTKEKLRTDELASAVHRAVSDSLAAAPRPKVPAPKRDARKKRDEWALWHLTDWQGSKVTPTYSSKVMRRRVEDFWAAATKITEIQRADHPVKSCAILFGGDMIEGLFNFPQQPFEIDSTLFDQWRDVSILLADTVRYALSAYERVSVFAEWGNHGRIGSKRATVPSSDNFDRMCYETARMILAGEERLSWEDCPEDVQRVEIGSYRALLIHGDEIGRNGFASKNTILQHVNRWRSGAYPWDFRDCYVGHYHTHTEEALANGEGAIYFTGSTESDNRYAREQLASSAKPSQRLHFIDPEKGRVTAQYKIWLP